MFEKYKLTKDTRWLVMASIGISALIAFPMAIRYFGGEIAEITSIWSSVLGAWSGIAGAFWVADRQASQQQRSAAALVREMLYPVTAALHELCTIYGQPSRPVRGNSNDEPDFLSADDWKKVCSQADLIQTQQRSFQNKIQRFETGLNLLSACGLQIALTIESTLDDRIPHVVGPLAIPNGEVPGYGYGHGFQEGPPTWSSRSELSELDRDIQKLMAQLENEAS